MDDPQVTEALLSLAAWCEEKGIAYIHLAEADWDDVPQVPDSFRETMRATFSGTIIIAGNYTAERAQRMLDKGFADLIAFGRAFIANPDLPYRMQHQLPLVSISDPTTLFGGTDIGYTDYLFYKKHKE